MERDEAGIQLPSGKSASAFLFELLRGAVERAPDALGSAELPADAREFRSTYGEALVRFEAARASSAERSQIARGIVRDAATRMAFGTDAGAVPLPEYWTAPSEPLRVDELALGAGQRLRPRVPFEGRVYAGKELIALADQLLERAFVTKAAAAALRWIAEYADTDGGIDLTTRRFAVLGAGAELASTSLLLEAGAWVLWIDVSEPDAVLGSADALGGRLSYVRGGADLLRQPLEIARTVERFAADGPVDLALYAYAGGGGREWRLTSAMNGIVTRLGSEPVRSVSLLVSPTSPSVAQPEDCRRAQARELRWWESALQATGAFPPARLARGDVEVVRAVVPRQGASYQAAQYVAKILTAESLANFGPSLDGEPLTVSANVAGVSRTRSLSHPVFEAAFAAAPLFGVTTFAPETTRALNGLLTLHDLLNPDAPGSALRAHASAAERAAALFSQQVHGGIYAIPWALNPCITVAAGIGLVQRPDRIWRLLR